MYAEQLDEVQRNPPSPEDRVDISAIQINESIPAPQRAEQYLAQIKNPYAFQYAGIAVNVAFSEEGKSLKEALTSYLSSKQ